MVTMRDETAIVGVGMTEFGPRYRQLDPEVTTYDFAAEAFESALADSGLQKSEVDGLVSARIPSYARLADVLGIRHPRIVNTYEGTGRMSGVALQTAVMAIVTGQAEVVACVYGNNGRSAGARYGGGSGDLRHRSRLQQEGGPRDRQPRLVAGHRLRPANWSPYPRADGHGNICGSQVP